MTCILIATDLSARSDRAIERGFMLARDAGLPVTLVSAIDDSLPASLAEPLVVAARDRLNSHIASLTIAKGIEHDVRVVFAQPYRAILAAAAELDPTVIVLGVHRHRGFLDLFRGTTVARVTRNGIWPVLIAVEHPDRPYQRVLNTTDFSPASRRAYDLVRKLSPNANRRLLHAYLIPFKGFAAVPGEFTPTPTDAEIASYRQEAEAEMKEFARGLEPKPAIQIEEGTLPSVLRKAFDEFKPDLIALGSHGRSGLARAILGTTAEDLMSDPPCDLLVVR